MMSYFSNSKVTPWLLTLSIILFLMLDLCLLGLNFRVTKEVSEDALVINLAGRQRMLTQRMSKAIFQIDKDQINSPESQLLIEQFDRTYRLFSKTIDAFYYGGLITDAESNMVTVNRINLPEARSILFQARQLSEIIAPLNQIVAEHGLTSRTLNDLRKIMANVNDQLLDMMNQLTVIIEKNSKEKTQSLRTIQLVTFCFALLNFAAIISLFRQTHKQSKDLVSILDELFQSTNAALIVFSPDQRVIMSNKYASHLFGYSHRQLHYMKRSSLLLTEGSSGKESISLTQDGRELDVEVHERTVTHKGKQLHVVTIMDVSSHVERERQDPLTGMQNRHALAQALESKSEQVRALGGRFACFFVDLDGFKEVNDKYGHDAGDCVLKCFASRLKNNLRDNDRVYRFGGDEFIVLVDLSANDIPIEMISQKLHAIMQKPINLHNHDPILLSLSAGVAVYPDDTSDTDQLINLADQSMYRAKHDHSVEVVRYHA
ncbi:diguanylate cyclase [Vibrio sp.]|nr:diguanylate cyclase [Vibrio sp.]